MSQAAHDFHHDPEKSRPVAEDATTRLQALLCEVAGGSNFRSIVLSRPRNSSATDLRVVARPVEMKAGRRIQLARRTATQEFHRNLTADEATQELQRLASDDFSDVRIETPTTIWHARWSRKKSWRIQSHVAETPTTTARAAYAMPECSDVPCDAEPHIAAHNKPRQYLIPEGIPCPFLIQTGIMTPDGKVRTRHYRKFRQINRYLEFIHDVLKRMPSGQDFHRPEGDSNAVSAETPIRIVDFGCGKSYLTFATHYLLTTLLNRPCRITGLDRRLDVVQSCQRIVADLQLQGLDFELGEISGYQPQEPVNMAISLHACDTATDDALRQAVDWGCQVILAVPCCQHELAACLNKEAMPVMTDHGILRERFASMATDAMRAAVLEVMGYDTALIEFVDMEHTPKNVLIRAVRRNGSMTEHHRQRALLRLADFRAQLRLPALQLERMLIDHEPSV